MSDGGAIAEPPKAEPDTRIAVDWDDLSLDELEAMHAAGLEVQNCVRVLAKTGDNIVGELLKDQGVFYEWEHYPKGDVYDHETHSQYYYHAHPDRDGEHGHFHTFLRPKGMPRGVRPAPVPGFVPPEKPDNALSHLVGVSMDKFGQPVALFTTNRWVTGEVWYKGDDVMKMLDFFEIDIAHPSWPVNRWLSAILRLFRPQIMALVAARDRAMDAWAKAHPGEDIYEDRRLEVISQTDISVDDQMKRVRAAMEKLA